MKGIKIQKSMPYVLLVGSIIGLIASFVLTIEHINIIENPDHHLSCSINPVLACGPVMLSKEASIFGFPNPIIGLVAFSAQIMLAIVMLAGAKMKRLFWQVYGVLILFGLAITFYLLGHSLYSIGKICIYCFVFWIAMFFTSWYVFQYMLAEKHINLRSKRLTKFIRQNHGNILFVFYLVLAGMILSKFWYYYGPMLGFK